MKKIDALFETVHLKLKKLAKVCFILSIVISVVTLLVTTIIDIVDYYDGTLFLTGLLSSIAVMIISLVSSWFIYATGEKLELLHQIEKNTRIQSSKEQLQQ